MKSYIAIMQFRDRHLKDATGKMRLIRKGEEYPPKGAVFPANLDIEAWVERLASGNNAIKEPVLKEVESADVSEQEIETFVNITGTSHLIAEMDELIDEVENEIYLDNPFEAKAETSKPTVKKPAPKKKKKKAVKK